MVLLVAGYILSAVFIGKFTDVRPVNQPLGPALADAATVGAGLVLITTVPFFLVFLLSRIPKHLGWRNAPSSTWSDYRKHLAWDRLLGLFTVWVLLHLLLNQFVGFKRVITEFNPFAWDVRFMELDRVLHLGTDPWRLLHPFLGKPEVTWVVDKVYVAWFAVNAVFFHWMGFRRWDPLRTRFFLTYFLCWIFLGTVLATVFSSAGPVYYEGVVGVEGPYGPLLAYLREVGASLHLVALDIQAFLWDGYSGASEHAIEGIAAMPSLHVAIPVLLTITAFRLNMWLGCALAVYAALILLGSVHLAWHYAVDGYASVLLVPALWVLSGWVAKRSFFSPVQQEGESVRQRVGVQDPASVRTHHVSGHDPVLVDDGVE
jgi:hypothetical protein